MNLKKRIDELGRNICYIESRMNELRSQMDQLTRRICNHKWIYKTGTTNLFIDSQYVDKKTNYYKRCYICNEQFALQVDEWTKERREADIENLKAEAEKLGLVVCIKESEAKNAN
jgi:hypothetical protein